MVNIIAGFIEFLVMGFIMSFGLQHFAKGDYSLFPCMAVMYGIALLVRASSYGGVEESGEQKENN